MSEEYGAGYDFEGEDVIKFLRRIKYNMTHHDGLKHAHDPETMGNVIEHVMWSDGYIAGVKEYAKRAQE